MGKTRNILYEAGELDKNGKKYRLVLLETKEKLRFYAIQKFAQNGKLVDEFLFEPEIADLLAGLIKDRPKEFDVGETRKIWTKSQVLKLLGVIAPALTELEKLAPEGGQMPARLRRKIKTTNSKVRDLIKDLQGWDISTIKTANRGGKEKNIHG